MSLARDVTYLCPYSGPSRGVLKVTNYQLHFRPTDTAALQSTLSVPLGVVSYFLIKVIVYPFVFIIAVTRHAKLKLLLYAVYTSVCLPDKVGINLCLFVQQVSSI